MRGASRDARKLRRHTDNATRDDNGDTNFTNKKKTNWLYIGNISSFTHRFTLVEYYAVPWIDQWEYKVDYGLDADNWLRLMDDHAAHWLTGQQYHSYHQDKSKYQKQIRRCIQLLKLSLLFRLCLCNESVFPPLPMLSGSAMIASLTTWWWMMAGHLTHSPLIVIINIQSQATNFI